MAADVRSLDRQEFLAVARPALAAGDAELLAEEVLKRWTPRQLCRLLGDSDVATRQLAAVTLGLVGDASCIGCLARALHDEDEGVNRMAEHGLWSIWFRSGKSCAISAFSAGIALLEQEAYAKAIIKFEDAAAADPDFAEAYNQCAIAHFFLGQWREAIADSERAVERMPSHFGALAGMGHCHLQLNEVEEAVCCYRRSLAINPRQPDIESAIDRLQAAIRNRVTATTGSRPQ